MWLRGKESSCQCRRCRRHGFDPWVGKILWRRKWQPTAVSLPGECHGQRSLAGYSPGDLRESDTTEWLRAHTPLDPSAEDGAHFQGWGLTLSELGSTPSWLPWAEAASAPTQLAFNLQVWEATPCVIMSWDSSGWSGRGTGEGECKKLSSEPEFGSGLWICRSVAVSKPPRWCRKASTLWGGRKWAARLSTCNSQSQLPGLLSKVLVNFKFLTNLNTKYQMYYFIMSYKMLYMCITYEL